MVEWWPAVRTHALVVCLWASPEKIWERVRNQTHRPLLHEPDPQKKIRDLLAAREPFYSQADVLVNTDMRSVREVAQQVVHQFRLAQAGSGDERRPSDSARWNWALTIAGSPPPPRPPARSSFKTGSPENNTAKWPGSNATRQSASIRKRFCPARKASFASRPAMTSQRAVRSSEDIRKLPTTLAL